MRLQMPRLFEEAYLARSGNHDIRAILRRQCGLAACKVLMKEGGVIRHETVRSPLPAMHPATRAGLIEIARRLDPVVLRWGR